MQYGQNITQTRGDNMDKLEKAVKRFYNAAREDSWKGGGHPEDIPSIEQELTDSIEELGKVLKVDLSLLF